jgi:hypothetical protein
MANFRDRFRADIHRFACEDFLDSFTPGDSITTPKKPVMLPMSWYREKAFITIQKLNREGLSTPSDFDIMKEAQEIFGSHQGDSMLSNPSTPKIPAEMYDTLDFIKTMFPDEESRRQFKGAHMVLAGLFLKRKLGLKDLDFEIQGKGEDANRGAVLNQYRRYVIGMMLAEVIRLAYEVKPEHIEELLKNTGALSMPTGKLKSSETRREFAKGVSRLTRLLFGNQNLGSTISREALK